MKCVSLFSGCGGLDLGLKQAGFSIALASDNEPLCQESHKANFPRTPFVLGSVSDLDLERMQTASKGKVDVGIDLLAGGPPCPPYSKSRFYRKSKPRALEDEVGEETLNGYLSTLRSLMPRAFLLENVAGMAYKVHSGALELILQTAEELGYTCSYRVVNSADYGVPQIRERFILVGMRGAAFQFPEATHTSPQKDLLSGIVGLPRWVTAGEAIADLDTDEKADDVGHFAGGKYHGLLEMIPPGENYLFFTKERGHPAPVFEWRSRYWSFLLKLSPEMPSWTIQARRSNNMGPFHWRNRILRIEEVKRLQTFPDDWRLVGRLEMQWRQIGNAVPPLLAYHLGKALAAQLGEQGKRDNGAPVNVNGATGSKKGLAGDKKLRV